MIKQSFNINEAAEKLGVSTRTVRRYIKAGKIRAELVKGNFGDEYRILELPPQLDPNLSMKRAAESAEIQVEATSTVSGMELIRELQEKNLALAAQLGAAAERIHNLEGQLKLLAAPRSGTDSGTAVMRWWDKFKDRFSNRSSG